MKHALIVGGARSGKYIALLLNEHNYKVTLTDYNTVEYKKELESNGISVVDGGHPDSLLETTYDLVVKNPGIKYTSPFIVNLLKQGYRIYNEIEVSLRFVPDANVLAITGTNGKTTTVSMLGEMMQKSFSDTYIAGNIGNAVSETVYNHPDLKNIVIEMSSFQLDGTYDFHPHSANITNLQMDHLDYYDSIEDYYSSKQRIYKNQTSDDYLLVNGDDPVLLDHLKTPSAKIITYGIDNPGDLVFKDSLVTYNNDVLFDINDMKVVGKHNVYNAIVASLMAYVNDVPCNIISTVVSEFRGVEHRIEYVKSVNDVKYYNDSKATNVESLLVALQSFDKPVILLAGGYDKKISFEQLKSYDKKVKHAILFGETKEQLSEVFSKYTLVETLEDAVQLAHKLAVNSDVVLFSPACASFDQFNNFEERGTKYKQFVNQL